VIRILKALARSDLVYGILHSLMGKITRGARARSLPGSERKAHESTIDVNKLDRDGSERKEIGTSSCPH